VTSTKNELVAMTAPSAVNAGRGRRCRCSTRPGWAGWPPHSGCDPLAGCTSAPVADARARALVRGDGGATGTQNAELGAAKAAEIARCYLLAAALTGPHMGAVMGWALNPGDQAPTAILRAHTARVPPGWLGTLEANLGAAANTGPAISPRSSRR